MVAPAPKSRYSDYEPRGAMLDLWLGTEPECIMHGPAETGKSRGVCEYLLWLCETWPGLRVLVVRRTRKSLSESFVQTFERLVLPKGHPLLAKRITPTNRHSYDFDNGSRIVLGSMETPEAYYSTEWDIVFVEECTEIIEDQWERFFRAIRFKTIPHPHGPEPTTGEARYLNRLIGTCNPDSERHWIMARSKRKGPDGKPLLRMIQSRHVDNPTFTKQSRDRLDRMTGVRRKRLRDGIWCSAEGGIWENFDRNIHVIADHPRRADRSLAYEYFVAGVDWGTTHAGCISIYGVDYDGRMYRAWEVMREQWGINEWIERAMDLDRQFKPKAYVCDSEDPGRIREFRKAGLPAVGVKKSGDGRRGFVWLTLDLVRDRLDVQKDGRPRLFFVADQFDTPQPEMVEAGKPTCVEDEIPSYVFDRDRISGRILEGEPAPNQDDHGCAAMRYAVAYVERYNQTGARAGAQPTNDSQPASTWDLGPSDGLEMRVLSGEHYRDREDED